MLIAMENMKILNGMSQYREVVIGLECANSN
jgi:hypothetical protein